MLAQLISLSPLKLNPYAGILCAFILVYIPHILKIGLVKRKLKEKKIKMNIADSRLQSELCLDDSDLGRAIAAHVGCHQNHWEALSYFSAAVLSAVSAGVDKTLIESAVGMFIIARSMYTVFYLSAFNGPLRSLAWMIGLVVCGGLLHAAYSQTA